MPSRGSGGDVATEDEAETAAEPDDDQYGVDEAQYAPNTGTVSPTAETDLPDTGGISPALTVIPMALLLASGILVLRSIRR